MSDGIHVHKRRAGVEELVRLADAASIHAVKARARGDQVHAERLAHWSMKFLEKACAGGGEILCCGEPGRVAVNPYDHLKPGGVAPWNCDARRALPGEGPCFCHDTGHGSALRIFRLGEHDELGPFFQPVGGPPWAQPS